ACFEETQVVFTDEDSITYTLPDYVGSGEVAVTDNCTDPVEIYTQTPAPGTLLTVGMHTITITATDEYGNESSCSFELEVQDELGNQDILQNAIVMYPNPAANVVNITNSSSILLSNVAIYDIAG